MKINEELSILFWLRRSNKTIDGFVTIYVRITVNGLRDNYSTGRKIRPEHWHAQTGMALKTCPDAKAINSYIINTRVEIEKHYIQLSTVHKCVTPLMIKESLNPDTKNKL
ncbi:Arm DNA-binding domain-containing protein [Pedobacter sp. MW01-1-1]|uniref:Arm DNA-binding domain-containing protein n=1 Tax=Pedobacter sp. MW01-1-1 TaxID=3383027 RepID=UPI003FF0336A